MLLKANLYGPGCAGLWAAAVVTALAILFKVAANCAQPGISWLMVGALTATVLWLVLSGGLALYLSVSSTLGDTYGPLAGLIGLMIWAQLSGLATLAGLAFAAQLECERVQMAEEPEPAISR